MLDIRNVFLFQLVFLSIALPVAFARPSLGHATDRRLGAAAAKVGSGALPWLIGLVALGGSIAVSMFVRFPHPWVQDEFSYLLSADTFLNGRLTNPSHELWPFFDTFHVLQKPTYASKYPPGQGLLLATGELIGGNPVLGVWLGVGLACASICWMLQAFVSRRWAAVGGLLAVINFGFFSPWTQSYVVNALSATGGSLVLGGFQRLSRQRRATYGIPIGAGWLILSITRPFEGLVFSVPFLVLLGVWLFRAKAKAGRRRLYSATAVIAIILAVGATAQAHYNRAVTGSFATIPYVEYQRQYEGVSEFLWRPIQSPPEFNNEVARSLYVGWAVPHREEQSTLAGLLAVKTREFVNGFAYLLQFSLWLPILVFLSFKKNPSERFVLIPVAAVSLALVSITWVEYRMLAPLAGPLVLLVVLGLKRIRSWSPGGRRVGRVLALGVIAATVMSLPLGLVPFMQEPPNEMAQNRAKILRKLDLTAERHLVIVRYLPSHNYHEEWVYNRANIDTADVVWARERSPSENQNLLRYYPDRTVWLLDADDPNPTLRPYSLRGNR